MRLTAVIPSLALVVCTASACITTTTGRPRETPTPARVPVPSRANPNPNNVDDGWVLLGERDVSDKMDHDVIKVGENQGTFRAIRITVRKADVNFKRVRVHYRKGKPETIELRNTIPAGASSRVIDLSGRERVIDRVDFWYDAEGRRGKQALVRLMAKH